MIIKCNHTYKDIMAHLLLWSIFLFTDCKPPSATPIAESLELSQQVSQDGVLVANQQADIESVHQEGTGFLTLPIELQAYILSFLGQKDFYIASFLEL